MPVGHIAMAWHVPDLRRIHLVHNCMNVGGLFVQSFSHQGVMEPVCGRNTTHCPRIRSLVLAAPYLVHLHLTINLGTCSLLVAAWQLLLAASSGVSPRGHTGPMDHSQDTGDPLVGVCRGESSVLSSAGVDTSPAEAVDLYLLRGHGIGTMFACTNHVLPYHDGATRTVSPGPPGRPF